MSEIKTYCARCQRLVKTKIVREKVMMMAKIDDDQPIPDKPSFKEIDILVCEECDEEIPQPAGIYLV